MILWLHNIKSKLLGPRALRYDSWRDVNVTNDFIEFLWKLNFPMERLDDSHLYTDERPLG